MIYRSKVSGVEWKKDAEKRAPGKASKRIAEELLVYKLGDLAVRQYESE